MQLFVLTLAALVAVAVAGAIDATDADFDTIIAQHPFAIVEFYAPWCGHCKRLAPEWEIAADQLVGKAALIKVDCTVEKALGQRFGIQGFPTLKVFRDGQFSVDYDGGRTADGIVKYALANTGPAVTIVESEEQLQAIQAESDFIVVAFAAESSELAKTFESVANSLRARFRFVRAAAAFGSEKQDTIVALKNFDERRAVLDEEATASAITDFVQGQSVRLFDEIGPENYKGYMERGLPMVWLFVQPTATEEKAAVEAAAKDHKNTASFVWCDASKYGQMAERLGLEKGKFPSLAVDVKGKHYVYTESEIATAAVSAFVGKVLAGEVQKTIRSEPAPAQPLVDGLLTVVGSTFDELIVKNENDVFVEFYAPWCGHCKKLDPEMKQLAKDLAAVKGLNIVQFDASSNDHDDSLFDVKGFPTLYFYSKTKSQPESYEGPRTAAGILEYLKKTSTADFSNVATADTGADEL